MKRSVLVIILVAILGAVYCSWRCWNSMQGYTGKMESITVAYSPFESTAFLWIAENQHYFSRNGLNVTFRKYDSGAGALSGMLKGEADIAAGTAEFPLVIGAFQKENFRIIGNIDKAEFIYLIGRKDRGIRKVSDLKGKRIGTTFGTVAHFCLGRFLELHDMNMQDITPVDLKTPEEWVNSAANGDVDAIATSQPYANSAKERLGTNAVPLSIQSSQPFYALIISTDEWITKCPKLVSRFLKSLAQAEEYATRNPAEAKAIVQKRLNLDAAYMETVWSQNEFSLSLDQSLILAMEDEARWMIKNNLTSEKQMPNFLDYIHEDSLKQIRPEAVNVIR